MCRAYHQMSVETRDKHIARVLLYLHGRGPVLFAKIADDIGTFIGTRTTLSNVLGHMASERYGLVSKTGAGPRWLYALTPKGELVAADLHARKAAA